MQDSVPKFAFEQAITKTTDGPRKALMLWSAVGFILGSLGIEVKTLAVGGATLQSQQDLAVIVPGFIGIVVAYRFAGFLLTYGSATSALWGLRRYHELRQIERSLNSRAHALVDLEASAKSVTVDDGEFAAVFKQFKLPKQLADYLDDAAIQEDLRRLEAHMAPSTRQRAIALMSLLLDFVLPLAVGVTALAVLWEKMGISIRIAFDAIF